MTKFFIFFFSLLLTVSASAYQFCENGSFNQMGDGYFSLEIHSDKIVVSPYESGFTVLGQDIVRKGSTILVGDTKVEYTSEGDVYSKTVDMIINGQPSMVSISKINIAISTDKGAFNNYEMTCYLR
jgi:hypothetical protein